MTVQACLLALPKVIKIGAYDWRVVVIDEPHDEICGQSDFESRQMRLWPKNLTDPSHAVGVTLHECLHVIFDNHGLENLKRAKDDREEQIILGFEAGMVSLFRDNPKLLIWMKRWLR